MKHAAEKSGTGKDTAGFTLVELLISFSIFAVLVLAVTPVFRQGYDYWQIGRGQVELRQNLNSALEYIAGELRIAGGDSGSVTTGGEEPNSGFIVKYRYEDGGFNHYFFRLEGLGGGPRYIVFDDGSNAAAVTSTSVVNIVDATVKRVNPGPGYDISITGEYVGPDNRDPDTRQGIKGDYLKLTVKKRVVPRKTAGFEDWQEVN